MENASKALLMAAGILISVIILTLAVYLFVYFADYAKGVNDDVKANQIAQFNSQFLSYQGKELTIYDVITLANMAKNYNQNNNLTSTDLAYISVNLNGTGITNVINFENAVGNFNIGENSSYVYSNENAGELRKYIIQDNIVVNNITKLVKTITIRGL